VVYGSLIHAPVGGGAAPAAERGAFGYRNRMMIAIRLILFFALVAALCLSASAQSPFDDSSMRGDVASRIARDHGGKMDWQ
jgi:hypothetical protein